MPGKKLFNIHSNAPYNIFLVHGGPGAIGDMFPVANELSEYYGVIEIYNEGLSIKSQLQEIFEAIVQNTSLKVLLIGHSWGAWLVFLFAAKYPEIVRKIILIGSGPFEAKYAENITNIRFNRLNKDEQLLFQSIAIKLGEKELKHNNEIPKVMRSLLLKTDSFALSDEYIKEVNVQLNYKVYKKIWPEADSLRKSGELLQAGKYIKCPVFAIHGDYDPHEAKGVIEPLSKVLENFNYTIIYKCGHYPWFEKYARKKFYNILLKEIEFPHEK